VKRLAWGIFAAFSVLLCVSVYIAERMHDGTVEEDYYGKSLEFFRDRKPAAAAEVPPGPLVASAAGQTILLDIEPKPVRTMRELTFSVELPGYDEAGIPRLDLGMAGMRMAPNRIDLVKEGDGRYRGRGVIVKCPSGMRTWTAVVHLPGKGKATFTFDAAD
jgi:hypothetical protein